MLIPLAGVVDLDRDDPVPLHRQLYLQLRAAMVRGDLVEGDRLPSSRAVSWQLGVSRNTVLEAIEQLKAEGFLTGKIGSGTYVKRLHRESISTASTAIEHHPRRSSRGPSKTGQRLASTMQGSARPAGSRAFWPGMPDLEMFPHASWARLLGRNARQPAIETLGYPAAPGHLALREALIAYLRESRGVRADADQVFITSSAQAALDLTARVLVDRGDVAWIEEPGYLGARAALTGAGAQLIGIEIDEFGMNPDVDRADARVIYVSPSHQYPTGVTLSLDRRLALLERAYQMSGYIIEDDYDSEFRYLDRPIAALQALDRSETVIYVGTFSKSMQPGIRTGYLVAPRHLCPTFESALRNSGQSVATVVQAALADFLNEGRFSAHMRRMRSVYRRRRERLLELLAHEIDFQLEIFPSRGGMQVTFQIDGIDDRRLVSRLLESNVGAAPLSVFYLRQPSPGLVLGFAAVPRDEMKRGVKVLSEVLGEESAK